MDACDTSQALRWDGGQAWSRRRRCPFHATVSEGPNERGYTCPLQIRKKSHLVTYAPGGGHKPARLEREAGEGGKNGNFGNNGGDGKLCRETIRCLSSSQDLVSGEKVNRGEEKSTCGTNEGLPHVEGKTVLGQGKCGPTSILGAQQKEVFNITFQKRKKKTSVRTEKRGGPRVCLGKRGCGRPPTRQRPFGQRNTTSFEPGKAPKRGGENTPSESKLRTEKREFPPVGHKKKEERVGRVLSSKHHKSGQWRRKNRKRRGKKKVTKEDPYTGLDFLVKGLSRESATGSQYKRKVDDKNPRFLWKGGGGWPLFCKRCQTGRKEKSPEDSKVGKEK